MTFLAGSIDDDTILARLGELIVARAEGRIARFARLTGVRDSAIRAWFARREANLTAENLERICRTTGVSADWLLFGRPEADAGWRALPWRSWRSPDDGDAGRQLPAARARLGVRAFALAVPTDFDRMTPRIEPGALLVVDPDAPPREGQIVVAVHEGRTIVGRLHSLDGRVRQLTFDNPAYPPLRLERRWRSLGVVREITVLL
jgi:transcriptional regulator with XRE-family HTH domain